MCITADEITYYRTNANFVYWPLFCSAFPTQHKLDVFRVVIKKSFERYDGRFFGRQLIVRNEKKGKYTGYICIIQDQTFCAGIVEGEAKIADKNSQHLK